MTMYVTNKPNLNLNLLTEVVDSVIGLFVFGCRFKCDDPHLKIIMETADAYFSVLCSPLRQAYYIFPRLVGKRHDLFKLYTKVRAIIGLEAEAYMKTLDLFCRRNTILIKNFIFTRSAQSGTCLVLALRPPQQWPSLDDRQNIKYTDAVIHENLVKLYRVERFIFFTSLLQHFTFKTTLPPEELETTPLICSFGHVLLSYECFAMRRA
ncbi:hypothetical protein P4O66_017770 [Electrophorus voltai]|uniref:Uncharacterized protein n=1 Tax=Electrophorus voltai TaxID=2609070 RepID=A0AAD8YU84_9TELE|nr:hypothetical protein P4O66_017770 [Electrophorus voltai]